MDPQQSDESTYRPSPIDIDDIELGPELIDLVERLAENGHDLWALQRLQDGWTLGDERNDARKTHPGLVAYGDLPESEKEYDRVMAVGTIKAIVALGFSVSRDSG